LVSFHERAKESLFQFGRFSLPPPPTHQIVYNDFSPTLLISNSFHQLCPQFLYSSPPPLASFTPLLIFFPTPPKKLPTKRKKQWGPPRLQPPHFEGSFFLDPCISSRVVLKADTPSEAQTTEMISTFSPQYDEGAFCDHIPSEGVLVRLPSRPYKKRGYTHPYPVDSRTPP